MDSLNFHHLRYFWAVARCGSLTRASAELHLTPQTVSTQIRDLENALGEKLFARQGRRLVLTETGHVVYGYACDIFSVGQELMDTLRGQPTGRPLRLTIGVADVLPKLVAHRLIEPALELADPVRVVCHEDRTEKLLGELALHRLDVVLSDVPIPPAVHIRAFNHLLGETGVTLVAAPALAARYRKGFPKCLDGAPFLLPTEDAALRGALDRWFSRHGIRPKVVGEFQDSALLKAFGEAARGLFAVPSVAEHDVQHGYGVKRIGIADGLVERFYAISVERRVQHPAVAAICATARSDLFGTT